MDERVEKKRAFIINCMYIVAIAAIVWLVLEYLLPWFLPFIIGYAIALTLKPIVLQVSARTKLSNRIVALAVLLLAYALLITLLIVVGIKSISLLRALFAALPTFYETSLQPAILEIDAYMRGLIGNILPEVASESNEILSETLSTLQSSLFSLSSYALSGIASLAGRLPQFFLTLLFSIMSSVLISMNYLEVARFLAKQTPPRYRSVLFAIKDAAVNTVLKYAKAYLILMCITFGELAVGLLLLGVEHAVPIALGIAIFDIFPVLGTGGIVIPWIFLSLLRMKFTLAAGLAFLYGVVALVRNIMEPRVVGSTLGLHPLITLIAIYIGFQWKGLFGMIFVPISVQIIVGLHKRGVIRLWRT